MNNLINLVITLVAASLTGLAFGLAFTVEVGLVAFVFMFGIVLHVLFAVKKEKAVMRSALEKDQ